MPEPPRETQRAALEPPGFCPASGLWPSGGPLSARLAVLLTARSYDQVPPTRSARDAQGGVPRRPGGIRPLPCIRPVALYQARLWPAWPSFRTARSWTRCRPSTRPEPPRATQHTARSCSASIQHPASLLSARPAGGPAGRPPDCPKLGPVPPTRSTWAAPGRHSAPPRSRPASAQHPARGLPYGHLAACWPSC